MRGATGGRDAAAWRRGQGRQIVTHRWEEVRRHGDRDGKVTRVGAAGSGAGPSPALVACLPVPRHASRMKARVVEESFLRANRLSIICCVRVSALRIFFDIVDNAGK